MLFHATVTHAPDTCPVYNDDVRPAALRAAGSMQDTARETGVTIHYIVTPAPAHVIYLLLEAEQYEPIGRFLVRLFPYPSEFAVSPVIHLKDIATVVGGPAS